ncbi:MAG: hypothetical protein R2716_02390 [Microthrixaceae bacterium]
MESDGVEEALLKVADSYIQLTAATREDSPIAKFLERKGEGLHHVGYRVDDWRRPWSRWWQPVPPRSTRLPGRAAAAPPWRSCTPRGRSGRSSN